MPFPGAIDTGQWTDYYFSADSGGTGFWPEGDDTNDGLSPQTAFETLDQARAICFAAPFTRCIFDNELWDVAGDNDHGAGIGPITDVEADTTGCPQDFVGAHEQPCFWFRGMGPDTAFDGTGGTPGTAYWTLETIAERAHLLVERIHVTGDTDVGSNVPIDQFERGIITVVGGDLTNGSATLGSTDNVASAHDVGAVHVYGRSTLSYSNPGAGTGGSPTFGANSSGNIAVHTATLAQPCAGCITCSVAQGSGTFDASLDTEAAATPAGMFVSGVKIGGIGAGSICQMLPQTTNGTNTISNRVEAIFASVAFLPDSGAAATNSPIIVPTVNPANAIVNLSVLYPTLHKTGSGETARFLSITAMTPTSQVNMLFAGLLVPPSRGNQGGNIIRILDDDWFASESTLRIVDTIYETEANSWRIDNTIGDCLEDTAEDLEACVNAIRAVPIEVERTVVATAAESGTSTGGSATTLVDLTQSWTVDEWAGAVLKITSGTGSPQTRLIVSNTANTLTVANAWGGPGTPDGLEGYTIKWYSDADGLCQDHEGADCDDHVAAGDPADYSIEIPERLQCPAFVCGTRITRLSIDPATHADAGRIDPGYSSAP